MKITDWRYYTKPLIQRVRYFCHRFLRIRGGAQGAVVILNDQQTKEIMSAINNLTAAVSKLTSSVDAVIAAPPVVLGVPEADVQAAADAVTVQAARLDSAVAPVATISPAAPAA